MSASDIDPLTEEEQKAWPKEPMVNLEKPFVDVRGRIQPLVDMMMKSAVLIESKKGTQRANHYFVQYVVLLQCAQRQRFVIGVVFNQKDNFVVVVHAIAPFVSVT